MNLGVVNSLSYISMKTVCFKCISSYNVYNLLTFLYTTYMQLNDGGVSSAWKRQNITWLCNCSYILQIKSEKGNNSSVPFYPPYDTYLVIAVHYSAQDQAYLWIWNQLNNFSKIYYLTCL